MIAASIVSSVPDSIGGTVEDAGGEQDPATIDGRPTIVTKPSILYGRTGETLKLLKAYHNVVQTQRTQVVIVHGTSGSGKTALVDILRETAVDILCSLVMYPG